VSSWYGSLEAFFRHGQESLKDIGDASRYFLILALLSARRLLKDSRVMLWPVTGSIETPKME
jgi:hypothetical protein